MKQMLVAAAVLLLGSVTLARGESLLDHQNGRYYDYEVSFWGEQTAVYDLQRGVMIQVSRAEDHTVLYDQGTESFYEIRKTGPCTYVGYDHETGATQVFQVFAGGTVSVCDPYTGEDLQFSADSIERPALR